MESDDSQNSVIQFFDAMETVAPPGFVPYAKGINLDDDTDDNQSLPLNLSDKQTATVTPYQKDTDSSRDRTALPSLTQQWRDHSPLSKNQYGSKIHESPMLLPTKLPPPPKKKILNVNLEDVLELVKWPTSYVIMIRSMVLKLPGMI